MQTFPKNHTQFAIGLALAALLIAASMPAYSGGKGWADKQLKGTGDNISRELGNAAQSVKDEAGRGITNTKDEAGRAISNIKDEAGRAQGNISDALSGKNMSDKQLIDNIKGGVDRATENVHGAVENVDEALVGFNKAWNNTFKPSDAGPNWSVLYRPVEKAVGDEAARGKKNLNETLNRATGDIQDEAGRAQKNIGDFLTGKNDNDKQLIENIKAGVEKIEQVGDEFRNPITRTGEQIKRSGEDIANETGRVWKNVPKVGGQAVQDIKDEAARAPQNFADLISGKNLSDKQTLDTIGGGLAQFNKAAGDAWKRLWCGQDCYIASPMTATDIYKATTKMGKDTKAEINRDINKIGTGKNVGRDISRAGDKAGDDISRETTNVLNQAGNAANDAGTAVSNAANDAGDAVADVMGW